MFLSDVYVYAVVASGREFLARRRVSCVLGVPGFADGGVFCEFVHLHDRQRHLLQLLAFGV